MIYVLLFLSVAFGTLKNTFSKQLGAMDKSTAQIHLINFYTMFLAWVVFIIVNKGFTTASILTIVIGILYALFSLISQIALISAMNCGPVAFTSLMFSCGFIISTILGAVYYRESIGVIKIVGIAVLVIAMWICISPKKTQKFSGKWFTLSFIAFLCAGIVGFMQKLHQRSDSKGELDMMLIIAFGIMASVSLVLYIMSSNKNTAIIKSKSFILCGLALGLCIAVQNKNNLFLAGVLPSAIFFPISNGGIILGSTVAASIMFNEKLTKIQIFGMILGVIAISVIGVF